jgi:hypothetical protein
LTVQAHRLTVVVQGPKKASDAVTLLRRAVRKANKGWVVTPLTDARGRTRGKGSHVMWAVFDARGTELARGSVTSHPGDMSWKVTRGFEADFEELLGEGWMDR